MGSAIAERIKTKYEVYVFDKDKNKTRGLSGIKVVANIIDLVKKVDTVILAVKPQDFDGVLGEIKNWTQGKLVVSIAAGIKTGHIERIVEKAKVIRVMPNIAAKIGEAESVLYKGKYAKNEDLALAQDLFNFIGKTWVLKKEEEIDAATAISGSGPAYIYYDMEINKHDPNNLPDLVIENYVRRLTEAGKKVGLDSQIASELALTTTTSSISLSAVSLAKGTSLAELRKQIASPKGTTEAALKILIGGGSWQDAAVAAKKRAEELSGEG